MNYKSKKLYDIKKEVGRIFEIDPRMMDIRTKKREIAIARQVCHWAGYYYTKETTFDIGYYNGKRDHSTVMYSVKSVNSHIKTNYDIACKIKCLLDYFKESGIKLLYPNGRTESIKIKIQSDFRAIPNQVPIKRIKKKKLKKESIMERLISERNKFLSSYNALQVKRERIKICTDVEQVARLAKEIAMLEKAENK